MGGERLRLGVDMGKDDSRRISLTLGLLFGVATMGTSSAAVALPEVADHFGVGIGTATWTISLYALMLGVTTAIHGRLSDLVGIRLPMIIGVGLMAGGAVAAAMAPSFDVLLVARLFQGAGAAAIPTLGVAAVSARYDGAVRGLALGRLAAITAALSALGPLVGGLIEAQWGWRGVMALPALGLLLVPLVWQALTTDGSGARLDLVGAALVTAAAAGLVLLVQSPSTGVWIAVAGALLMMVGMPLSASWVRRRPHGFLPLEVVRNPVVVRSSLAAAVVPASWFAILIAVPAVMAHAGWEPWQVGLLMVPGAILSLAMPQVAGRLLARVGGAASLVVAGLTSAVALLLVSLGAQLVSAPVLVVAVVLVCVAFGIGQPALMASVGNAVHQEVRGVALGVATLTFLVGGSIGSAVVGGLGEAVSIPLSLLLLAVLPLLALLVIRPALRRTEQPVAA
jgi:MFS family permease